MKKIVATLLASAIACSVYAAPETYKIEPTHTFVTYETKHFGTSTNRGRFGEIEGTITVDRAAKKGSANIVVQPGKVNTGVAAMDGHLQGKDFFNVAQFAQAVFTGDKFTFDAKGNVTAISGKLDMLGTSHPVTLKAQNANCYINPMVKKQVCGGDYVAVIDRGLWGMNYGVGKVGTGEVKLVIQVEAIKQDAEVAEAAAS